MANQIQSTTERMDVMLDPDHSYFKDKTAEKKKGGK
jgi:hypothetical protein